MERLATEIDHAEILKKLRQMKNTRGMAIYPTEYWARHVELLSDVPVRSVITQLIDANVLDSGRPYSGVLKPNGTRTESVNLENDKTAGENDMCHSAHSGLPGSVGLRIDHGAVSGGIDNEVKNNEMQVVVKTSAALSTETQRRHRAWKQ